MMITRDDLIRSEACWERVENWRKRHAPTLTAIDVTSALAVSSFRERRYIEIASGFRGYGDVYGDGYGYGYGNGDVDGDGYGYGYGDGDGYSDGYGYGYGDGYGYS